MINEKNYYGCALDLPQDDKRLENYEKQREERGFDDTETWSFDVSMMRYMSPRLKRLIEIQKDFILPPYEDYFDELEKLVAAADAYAEDTWDKEALITIKELFPKMFPYLWW